MGLPQSPQPLIVSSHPILTPHLHLIYSMEPAGPRGMAVVGAATRTALLLTEAGTLGVLLEKQLAPQSWLWPGQGTVVLLWRMWFTGGSVLCPVPASPKGNGVQPGKAARALAQGSEERSWADSTTPPGHT